jgi:hypothetical protein
MKRFPVTAVFAMLFISMLMGSRAYGQTNASAGTLKGIDAVQVLIEDLSDDAKAMGLSEKTVRTDVELKLQSAGIRVLSADENFKTLGAPIFYVNVHVFARTANMDIQLVQDANLVRTRKLAPVTTWSRGCLLPIASSDSIRSHLGDQVDQFLNDWLSVNRKR